MSTAGLTEPHHLPAVPPQAGALQGVLLLAGSCLPVLGGVLIAPVLPRMQDHFASVGGAAVLVPVALTIPSLCIALLAPVAGAVADRIGRRPLLIGALLAYAVFGTAPLWLTSLPAIVASRALVGVTEAAIMTCCTTLLGDYYDGARRNRYLGLQVMVTSLAASVFFVLGGVLGGSGWRTPFWLYLASLLLAPLMAVALIRPARAATGSGDDAAPAGTPWRPLLVPCALTLAGAVLFYVMPVEGSYLLDALGVEDTAVIGAVTGAAALATAIGGALSGRVSTGRAGRLLPVELLVVAAGLAVIWLGRSSLPVTVAGLVVASVGAGFLLPTLLIWTMSLLRFEHRGRGTGLWTSTFFLGQFLCPLIVLGLSAGTGSLFGAVGVLALFAVLMAVPARLVARRIQGQAV
ncbi:MFS transporter [Dactylosporangium siamense]|uniref:MFS transporter n=1 Tax=Dactylosporangium siamense TaxID=685454 RepID=A0A919U5Q3_9ACTN|nr:MFS transporter [Dactylosporangium siamense]GIG42597.1 MFS transporter [Dactylosporangium siamense]